MTTSYEVVGEHRDDPDRLLLLGDDGRHYVLELPDTVSSLSRIEDEWTIDPDPWSIDVAAAVDERPAPLS